MDTHDWSNYNRSEEKQYINISFSESDSCKQDKVIYKFVTIVTTGELRIADKVFTEPFYYNCKPHKLFYDTNLGDNVYEILFN